MQAAKAVTVYIPPVPNKHFVLPRPVRPYFTGREAELAQLEAAFSDAGPPMQQQQQQRFVIFGLGGCGKTELAFRYAHGARNRYWGVFFVDGSSARNATSSYVEIATLGGVEPNEKAAKHWLMTRALPWLLVVDNVDDEDINVEDLLPPGVKGSILITTRNPAHVTYGNAGDRYIELQAMKAPEAETLIIKAADEPRPWPKLVVDSAREISYALGFLPLALVQAAKAILKGICEWPHYMDYYERQTLRVRRSMHGRKRSIFSSEKRQPDDEDSSMNIFSTYEILYESLESSKKRECQDAVELLHIFSFFHFQNIRFDILLNAATNPLREQEQQERNDSLEAGILKKMKRPPRKPWGMFLRELRAVVSGKMTGPTPLPHMLRNPENLDMESLAEDVDYRLRRALVVLIERSLITRHDRVSIPGRYSMHRLVHKWVRERPEMSTAHQALWCQVSLTTLASSIRQPPSGDTEAEIQLRRELLPHIRHVRECQTVLDGQLKDNAAREKVRRAPPQKSYGRLQVEQDVRFSRAYSETGHFHEALFLQERASRFVGARLGADHPIAIMLAFFAAKSVWDMSDMNNATERLRKARALCLSTWGEDHPLTLDAADLLGSALHMKGRWSEATALHSGNVERMTVLYGEKHEKTLKSVRALGRMYYRYMDYERATALHQRAWEGMHEVLGETHLETLASLEDLATSFLRYEDDTPIPDQQKLIKQSYERMTFVWTQRKERLGAEHPYTLLSVLYRARVKSFLGGHKEAEDTIRHGLEIAERNFGAEHIAILMAKTVYAEVLVKMGRYAEAEAVFAILVDKKYYRQMSDSDGDHPDRLTNLWLLSRCLEDQGRWREALDVCNEFRLGLATIGGNGLGMNHKILPKIGERLKKLTELVSEDES